MAKFAMSEKILAEKTVCVLLIRGKDINDKDMWAYVGVRADNLEEFIDAQKQDDFDPSKYGIIIEHGEGNPSDEIKQKMETEYGFNHQEMIDVPDSNFVNEVISGISGAIQDKKE